MKQLLATTRTFFKQIIFLGLVCFGFCATSTWAATITATQSGGWFDTATWNDGVPTSTDIVEIPSGLTVTIPSTIVGRDADTTVNGTLENYGTINSLYSTFTNNGTIYNYAYISNYNIFINNGTIYNYGGFNNFCDTPFTGNPLQGNSINQFACPTSTSTDTPTATNTNTPSPTKRATATPSPTKTATNTPVNTYTATNTSTPTGTATNTPVNTYTATNTNTPSPSWTPSPTKNYSPTPSGATPTPSPTRRSTVTPAPTKTVTNTPTATNTPSPTPELGINNMNSDLHGVILNFESTGTEQCGSNTIKLTPKTDFQMYLYIESETNVGVYDKDGNLIAELDVQSNKISNNKASFHAFTGNTSDNASLSGTITYDKKGTIKSLNGTFIRRGIINSCYSSGRFVAKYFGTF